jgi:hypothetical protein
MNITVNVDEVTLQTLIREANEHHDGVTLADLVAEQVTARLVNAGDWYEKTRVVAEVRREVIAEAVRPQVEEAIAAPLQKTNGYGEPVGEPVTLRTVIIDEVRKMLAKPADSYASGKGTVLQAMVRKEVEAAFANEVRDAVKQAREQVSEEIGQMVASAVAAGMRSR